MSSMNDSSTNNSSTMKVHSNAGNDCTFESRLRLDADKISGKINEKQRQQLFTQLSEQGMVKTATHHKTKNRVYFALAASVVALAILIPRTMEVTLTDPTKAVPTPPLVEASTKSSEPVQSRLLANQQLTHEYQAIISDMEKLKTHLVQL